MGFFLKIIFVFSRKYFQKIFNCFRPHIYYNKSIIIDRFAVRQSAEQCGIIS